MSGRVLRKRLEKTVCIRDSKHQKVGLSKMKWMKLSYIIHYRFKTLKAEITYNSPVESAFL